MPKDAITTGGGLTYGDLRAALPRLGYSPSTCRDYAYALLKCEKVFDVANIDTHPLMSVGEFKRRFPLHGFSPDMPFKSEGPYTAWRKKVLASKKGYFAGMAVRKLSPENDGWTDLIKTAAVEADRQSIAPQQLIPLQILAKESRTHNVQPKDLSSELFLAIEDQLTEGRRESFKKALPLLERLRSGCAAIDAVLPPQAHLIKPVGPIPLVPLHLLEEAEQWVEEHCRGEYDYLEDEHEDNRSDKTKKTYNSALRSYLNTVTELGLVDEIKDLACALAPDIFRQVFRSWSRSEAKGGIKPQSMVQYASTLRMLGKGRGIKVKHIKKSLKVNKTLKKGKAARSKMSETPKVFCHWLLSDRRASLEFMSLHIRFFKRAEDLLEASGYRNLTHREREDMRQFGTLAAMAAIWLWIAPLRITNMLALTISGPQPKLHLPHGKRAHALLLIPGPQTKTKLPIRKKVSPGRSRALEAIDFYIKNIRPLHPLAATSPLLFPGYVDNNTPLDDGTVRVWLKRACRAIGFYQIKPHFFRHGIASLFLKNNPGAYTHAGRLLDDSPETVRKYYGFIDDAQVLEEAQGAWLQIAGFEEGASKPLIQKSTGW